jgi:HSP20 family protein
MLAKWESPFRDLQAVEQEFDRLMGRAFARNAWVPALDVRETEDRYEVTMDLPGLERDAVGVSFEDGTLTVSGKREFANEESGETYHRIERSFGTFARSVSLPHTTDAEKIQASFDKGVLTVAVPKAELAKPRTIEVKAK